MEGLTLQKWLITKQHERCLAEQSLCVTDDCSPGKGRDISMGENYVTEKKQRYRVWPVQRGKWKGRDCYSRSASTGRRLKGAKFIRKSPLEYFQVDQQIQHLALRRHVLSGLVQTQLAVSARSDAANG
jgi:hypothetical protein